MRDQTPKVLKGTVLEEQSEVTLEELGRFCAVRRESIVSLVEEGILDPRGGEPAQWRFAAANLRRAARALRLQRDLEINPEAVGLVLDLLEEVEQLRAELGRLPGERTPSTSGPDAET